MAGYIGTTPVPQATQHRESFTATGGQTSFATVGYTPQFIDVYLNGVKLAPADYTATNGSDVVLASGATASDILEIVAYTPFEIASQTFTGDTTANNFAVTGTFTSRGIDDNADAVAITIDSSERVGIGTSSPTQKLDITTAGTTRAFIRNTNLTSSGMYIGEDGTGQQILGLGAYPMRFSTNGSERMRLDASGNLLVGTTSTTLYAGDQGEGFAYRAGNELTVARSGAATVTFVRQSDDGTIVNFKKDTANVGSIGVNSGSPYFTTTDGGFRIAGNGALQPATSTGAVSDALEDLGSTSGRWRDLYLSGGVVFGDAGGSGTSTSNTLDDYEEGTWQPVAADNSSGGNTTTTGQGLYTKIGRLVIATCDITNINTTGLTSTSSFYVQGLPFTNNGTVRSTSTLQVNLVNNGDGLFAHLSENLTAFSFKYNDDSKNNTASGLLVSDINDDQADMFGITLVYHTST